MNVKFPDNISFIRGDKKDSRLIRWLSKMASTDAGRPILNGLHVTDDKVIACNGYRMVVVDKPEVFEDVESGKTIKGKVPAGAFATEFEEIEGKYPDYKGIYPKQEAKAFISINPKLLREMLDGLDDVPATIVIYDDMKPFEIYGKTRDERDAYMILMPMHRPDPILERPDGSTVKFKPSEDQLIETS